DVPGCSLALALCHYPVLNAYAIARMWIGPACDITGSKNSRAVGFHVFIHHNAAIDRQPGFFRQFQLRPYTHAQHNEIGIERCAGAQRYFVSINPADRRSQMENNTMALMQAANKFTDLRAHHSLQRLLLLRNYVYGDPPRAQRCSNFKANKARSHHDYLLGGSCPGNNGTAVSIGAQIINLGIRSSRNRQLYRISAGGQQERTIFISLAVSQHHALTWDIN